MEVERGVVKSERVRQNGVAEFADAPEGYAVGALTIFGSGGDDEESAA